MLNPTRPDKLVDAQNRPYFLWDMDIDMEAFKALLQSPEPEVKAYALGKLMRQAKPDDVFLFVTLTEIRMLWPEVQPYLGHTRPFWTWILEAWEAQGIG